MVLAHLREAEATLRGALGDCGWECCCQVLLPHLSPVVIDGIDRVDGTVVITAHPRARGSRWPAMQSGVGAGCCTDATDGIWRICRPRGGRSRWCCLVRRFFRVHVDCSACTFVEQVPGLTERHALRSSGLRETLVPVGLAVAGARRIAAGQQARDGGEDAETSTRSPSLPV